MAVTTDSTEGTEGLEKRKKQGVAVENPYPGLRAFEERDAPFFFGREQEARELLARVISQRVLLFYAQSGAGKSSLLRARLIPQLREKGYLVLPIARVSGARPAHGAPTGNIFLLNLMLAVDQGEDDPPRFAHAALSEFLAQLTTVDGTRWLYDPAARREDSAGGEGAGGGDGEGVPYVLIVDQFEEIITTNPDRWQDREGFFRQLNDALRADPYLRVVLTLREDFLASLDPYAPLMDDRLRARFYMQRMGLEAATDAVAEPARLAGRPFEPDVAQMLVANLARIRVPGRTDTVEGEFVEPVQLQVVCRQLWENLQRTDPGGVAISAADLAQAGDVDAALRRLYESSLAKAVAAGVSERRLRTWVAEKLITEAGTRGSVYRGEHDTDDLPNAVVDALTGLVRSEARAGGVWVELVHDRLVGPILESNRAWEAAYANPLAAAYRVWHAAGHPETHLPTGPALAAMAGYARAHPNDVTAEEKGFLDRSLAAEAEALLHVRARRRRELIGAAVTVGLALLFALLAAWGWSQARRADAERQAAVSAEAVAIQAQATAEQERAASLRAQNSFMAETERAQRAEESAMRAQVESAELAQVARARELVALAGAAGSDLPQRRLLLAAEAYAASAPLTTTLAAGAQVAAENELWSGLLAVSSGAPLPLSAPAAAAAFAPDGALWLLEEGGALLRWPYGAAPHGPPARIELGIGEFDQALFSPDARWLAVASSPVVGGNQSVRPPPAAPWLIALPREGSIPPAASALRLALPSGAGVQAIAALAFSPAGDRLAVALEGGLAAVYSLPQPPEAGGGIALAGPPLRLAGGDPSPTAAAFALDGSALAVTGEQRTAVWPLDAPAAPSILPAADALAWLAEGRLALAQLDDALIVVEPLTAGASLLALPAGAGEVGGGVSAVAPSDENTIAVLESEDTYTALATNRAGTWLAGATTRGTLWAWDLSALPDFTYYFNNFSDQPLTAVAITANDRYVLAGATEGALLIWPVGSEGESPASQLGLEQPLTSLAASADGNRIVAIGSEGGAHLFDAGDSLPIRRALGVEQESIAGLEFTPGGQALALLGSPARTFRLPLEGSAPRWGAGSDETVLAVFAGTAGDTGGGYLLTTRQGATALWRLPSFAGEPELAATLPRSVAAAFSPGADSFVLAGPGGRLRLYRTADATAPVAETPGAGLTITKLVFAPTGRRLAAATEQFSAPVVWDVGAGAPARRPTPADVRSGHPLDVAFSPDGARLATAGSDGVLRLWDAATGAAVRDVRAASGPLYAVAFSPDGGRLAVAGEDSLVSVWEMAVPAAGPRQVGTDGPVSALAFSPDSATLAAAVPGSGAVMLWTQNGEALLAAACAAAGRTLSREEWERFFPGEVYSPVCGPSASP